MHDGLVKCALETTNELCECSCYELMLEFADKVLEHDAGTIDALRFKAYALVEQFKKNAHDSQLIKAAIDHLSLAHRLASTKNQDNALSGQVRKEYLRARKIESIAQIKYDQEVTKGLMVDLHSKTKLMSKLYLLFDTVKEDQISGK